MDAFIKNLCLNNFSWRSFRAKLFQGLKFFTLSFLLSSTLAGIYAYASINWGVIAGFVSRQDWIDFFAWPIGLIGVLIVFNLVVRSIKICNRVKNSGRWDIILAIGVGVLITIYFYPLIVKLPTPFQYNIADLKWLIALFVSGFLAITVQKSWLCPQKDFFLDDQPEEDENNDYLNFREDAHAFAEQVLNGFSEKSIVFGLDAPWGAGKSTYVNFCRKYWSKKHADKVTVFEFQPLNFIGAEDIFDKFAIEFSRTIKSEIYVPDFGSAFSRYVRLLKNVSFDLWGSKLSINNEVSALSAFDELKSVLSATDRKIIVIIDDLDRLPLEDIKTVLDVVKKSFVLPNVTYVLCYETENINVFGGDLKTTDTTGNVSGDEREPKNWKIRATSIEKLDHEKVVEYFEKVINVKKTLVVPRENLKNYLISEIGKLATVDSDGEFFNMISAGSLEEAKAAVEKIFDPSEFDKYVTYIGDLRKIKRLINIIRMQVNNLNLDETDINFYDLINLFLIYINFPNIFRKIFITETGGARGFFSLSLNFDSSSHHSTYKNSKEYKIYIDSLQPKERFLVEKIFSENRFSDSSTMNNEGRDDVENPKVRSNSAAFNGGLADAGKNLEDYLNLIVKNQKPAIEDAYNFHFKNVKRLINGEKISAIFSEPHYDLTNNGERTRLTFLKILFSNLEKIPFNTAQEIIDYLLDKSGSFAVTENDELDIGIRHTLDLYLVELLNKRGWKDSTGDSVENTDENVKEIAKRIFGEESYAGRGILEKLSENSRGIAGIYDLLVFRLYCNQDRGGNFFNVYRSLGIHSDPNTPNSGPVKDLLIQEMREISQKVFAIFKERYITLGTNIFKEAESLTDVQCFGDLLPYVKKVAKEKMLDLEIEKKKAQSRLISLVLFQMGNDSINMGIGVGSYDETGNGLGAGIKSAINQYLFDHCFNIENDHPIKNAEYFVNFLLMNLGAGIGRRGLDRLPSKDEYLRLFNEKSLVDYWKKNSEKIKSHLKGKKMILHTPGYSPSYSEDLPKVMDFLDKLVASNSVVPAIPVAEIGA